MAEKLAVNNDPKSVEKAIRETSATRPVWVFKKSPRCGISFAVENDWTDFLQSMKELEFSYYELDVVHERPISQHIAAAFKVPHASPQVLLIIDGKVVFDISHYGIKSDVLSAELRKRLVN